MWNQAFCHIHLWMTFPNVDTFFCHFQMWIHCCTKMPFLNVDTKHFHMWTQFFVISKCGCTNSWFFCYLLPFSFTTGLPLLGLCLLNQVGWAEMVQQAISSCGSYFQMRMQSWDAFPNCDSLLHTSIISKCGCKHFHFRTQFWDISKLWCTDEWPIFWSFPKCDALTNDL